MSSPVIVSRIQNRRGTQAQFDALYPPGYDGVGGYNPPGTGPVGFTPENYPNVLLPGEIALCYDSRRVFMGNSGVSGAQGEFFELGLATTSGIEFEPISFILPPAGIFTTIPGLTYNATPFFNIVYSLTDDSSLDWNIPGDSFSRNGSLQVTAVKYVAAPPAATLTDTGTEINNSINSITFRAQYDITETLIEIQYTHDFPGNLIFNTATILWKPF